MFCFASLAADLRNFLGGRDKILGFLCIWNLLRHSMKIHRLYPIFVTNAKDNICAKNSVRCKFLGVQSSASSPAKHGDAYFSAVYGSVQDPIAAPGPYENQEP